MSQKRNVCIGEVYEELFHVEEILNDAIQGYILRKQTVPEYLDVAVGRIVRAQKSLMQGMMQ